MPKYFSHASESSFKSVVRERTHTHTHVPMHEDTLRTGKFTTLMSLHAHVKCNNFAYKIHCLHCTHTFTHPLTLAFALHDVHSRLIILVEIIIITVINLYSLYTCEIEGKKQESKHTHTHIRVLYYYE